MPNVCCFDLFGKYVFWKFVLFWTMKEWKTPFQFTAYTLILRRFQFNLSLFNSRNLSNVILLCNLEAPYHHMYCSFKAFHIIVMHQSVGLIHWIWSMMYCYSSKLTVSWVKTTMYRVLKPSRFAREKHFASANYPILSRNCCRNRVCPELSGRYPRVQLVRLFFLVILPIPFASLEG